MENNYLFCTPPQPPLVDSMASFDQNLLEFMLFNGSGCGGLIDDDPYHDLQIDAALVLPEFPDHDNVRLMDNRDYPLFSTDQVVNNGAHDNYQEDDDDQNYECIEEFSLAAVTSQAAAATRKDRSKTLVAERKRRVRMKEKLYELRSLVPNITKMDKASIIDDAVVYVNNLQSQTKKLMEEIRMLESSSSRSSTKEDQIHRQKISSSKNETKVAEKMIKPISNPIVRVDINHRSIIQVNAHEVGERKFYVKVEGIITGDVGLPSSLYSAMESHSCFHLENSNFSLISQSFELTLTFHVTGANEGMDAATMRLWVMGALLKEGFQFHKDADQWWGLLHMEFYDEYFIQV